MPKTIPQSATAKAAANPYLFRDILDAILYLFVYFLLPFCSVLGSIELGTEAFFFTAFSCCVCLVYDCYTRYDKNGGFSKKRKLYIIGGLNVFLILLSVLNIYFYLSQNHFIFIWAYIALVIPPIIGFKDLLNMIADDICANEKG